MQQRPHYKKGSFMQYEIVLINSCSNQSKLTVTAHPGWLKTTKENRTKYFSLE